MISKTGNALVCLGFEREILSLPLAENGIKTWKLKKVTIQRVGSLIPLDFRITTSEAMVRDLRLKLFTGLNLGKKADLMLYLGHDK